MTKFSRSARDEVPDTHSDNAQQRTRPQDRAPLSPKAVASLYAKGKERPDLAQGDKRDLQKPQRPEDQRQKNYDNDTSGWVRAPGEDATKYPCFDHGKFDKASVPQKSTGPRNTASGQDMQRSPFSKAHKTYGEK